MTSPTTNRTTSTFEPVRTASGVLEAERIAAIVRLPDRDLPKHIDRHLRSTLLIAIDDWTKTQRRSEPYDRAKAIALLLSRPADFEPVETTYLVYLRQLCGTLTTDALGIARPTALVLDMFEFLEIGETLPHLPTLIKLLNPDQNLAEIDYDFPFKPEVKEKWAAAIATSRRGLKTT